MGESIKELVERLDEHWGRRRLGDMSSLFADAADALEALTEERNRLKAELEWVRAMTTLVLDGAEALDIMEVLRAERDRMKAALETIAEGRDSGRHDGLPEEYPAHNAVLMHYIACEALEGREWERLGNEKVGTHGTPEDEDARKLEAMGQDPGMTLEELLAPATDPAPAVCEWSNASGRMVSTCMPNGVTIWLWNERNQEKCINCLNKIKFTEAK